MKTRVIVFASCVAAVAVVSACATQSAATDTTATGEAAVTEEKVVGPPEVAWKDLSGEQKGEYMKKVVMPKMRTLFREFDAEEFPELKCSHCHGQDAKARNFEMPSPDLPELPATKEGFDELAREHPKGMEFMARQVKPLMAQLLGMPEFDPANPQAGGFGCTGCHTMEKAQQ